MKLCFFVFVEAGKLQLILYSAEDLMKAIESLGHIPSYSKILELDVDHFGGGATALPGSSKALLERRDLDPASVLKSSQINRKEITGKKPRPRPPATKASILPPMAEAAILFFGCNTNDECASMIEYLQLNGGWFPYQVQRHGACQFAAFQWGIDCPQEYTNTHLRCQIVWKRICFKEFFSSILETYKAGNYGGKRLSKEEFDSKTADGSISPQERYEYHQPGPFSFQTYLEYLLCRDTWRDEITITLLSMIFQVCIITLLFCKVEELLI